MKTENQNRSQEPPQTKELVGVDLRRLVRVSSCCEAPMEGGEWYDNHYCTACNKATTGKDVMFPNGYRLLAAGEKLEKHDEGLHEEDGKWHEIGWLFAQCHYMPGFMVPIRRLVSDPNAGAMARGANESPDLAKEKP